MNIQDAFTATKTNNSSQLAKQLGLSPQAVNKWEKLDVIPVTGQVKVLEKLGLWPIKIKNT